jgi:hypothetical protein
MNPARLLNLARERTSMFKQLVTKQEKCLKPLDRPYDPLPGDSVPNLGGFALCVFTGLPRRQTRSRAQDVENFSSQAVSVDGAEDKRSSEC